MKKTIILSIFILSLLLSFVSIRKAAALDTEIEDESELIETYANVSSVSDEFSDDLFINLYIENMEELENIGSGKINVANAILRVNSDMVVVDSNGESLDLELSDCYNLFLKEHSIPVVIINDDDLADKFIQYVLSKFNLADMAVMSKSADILKKIRTKDHHLRAILDYTDVTSEINLSELVKTSTKSDAYIILLNEKAATKDNIEYLQARFKTVWIDGLNGSDTSNLYDIFSGAYAINTYDYEKLYSLVSSIKSPDDEKIKLRTTYNIAHRGEKGHAENSLEGMIAAVTSGATHIEIDAMLTSDGVPIIMHDSSIDRTTNGSGNVASLTFEQIKQYKIKIDISGTSVDEQEIPSLEEIFEYFKGKDMVIVLEIKDNNANFVPTLKELLDKYDIYDQVVCISFFSQQLERMHELIPEIPTAYLNSFSQSSFITSITDLSYLNSVADTSHTYYTKQIEMNASARGYGSFYWTAGGKGDIVSYMDGGITGVTNNTADSIAGAYKYLLLGDKYMTASTADAPETIDATVEYYYTGRQTTATGNLLYSVSSGNYTDAYYTIYVKTIGFYIVSDRIRIVDEDVYMSVSDIQAIIDKGSYANLSEDEIEKLDKVMDAYECLLEEDQDSLDISVIEQMIKDKEKALNPDPEPTPTPTPSTKKSGCGSVLASFSLIPLLLIPIISFKKKENQYK